MSDNYISNYKVDNFFFNFPNVALLYELPIVSFKNIKHSISLSLIYNESLNEDVSYIRNNFKINLFKKLFIDNDAISLLEEDGKIINLLRINNNLYTFDDESKRVLRKSGNNYIIEYSNRSKEVYDSFGRIVSVYDKYNNSTPFLTFAYELNTDKLLSINYSVNKQITFDYYNNKLSTISYYYNNNLINETNIDYDTELIVKHYSLVDYHFSFTNNSIILYTTEADGYFDGNLSRKIEAIFNSNLTTVNYYAGTELMDYNNYYFIHFSGENICDVIDVENKYGIRERNIYIGNELVYAYEVEESEDNIFVNNKYKSSVQIHNKKSIVSRIGYDNHTSMTYFSNQNRYYFEMPSTIQSNEFIIFSGFIKAKSDNLSGYIDIINNNLLTVYRHNFYNLPYNKWIFVSFVISNNNYNNLYVAFSHNTTFLETKDFRISTVKNNSLVIEEILIAGDNIIPFEDISFSYIKNNNTYNLSEYISVADIIKYLYNQNQSINSDEIYSNEIKNIINDVTSFNASYTINNTTISNPVSSFSCGYRIKSEDKEAITKISFCSGQNYIVEIDSIEDNILVERQRLNSNQDLIYSKKDNYILELSRNSYGKITQITYNNEYSHNYYYDQYCDYLSSFKDEQNNYTYYSYDPVFGVLLDETNPYSLVTSDSYDDSKEVLLERNFHTASLNRLNELSYIDGEMSGISSHGVIYNYSYNLDYISSITKNNNLIKTISHSYDDTNKQDTIIETTQTTNNLSYSNTTIFDKYNRLKEKTGEIINTYDISPYFSVDTHQTIGVDNSSSKLSTMRDLKEGTKYEYGYTNDLLTKEIIRNYSTNSIKRKELYEYDSYGRITKDSFYYNSTNNVETNITYSNTVNKQISSLDYKIGSSTVSQINNTYNAYNNLTQKSIDINSNNYKRTLVYSNDRISQYIDSLNNNYTLRNISLVYDSLGRIVNEIDNNNQNNNLSYEYNEFNELVRENNKLKNSTMTYSYDNLGNITSYKKYPYTLGSLDNLSYTERTFSYDSTHKDRLISVDSLNISYNKEGCPTNYQGKTLTWTKGKLTKVSWGNLIVGKETYNYSYDAFGRRISKSYTFIPGRQALVEYTESKTINYTYDSSNRLIKETSVESLNTGININREIIYIYDNNEIIGAKYKKDNVSNIYYFDRDIKGNIIKLYDSLGSTSVFYMYNAYGEYSFSGSSLFDLIYNIPIRYRGYYSDLETGFYYLHNRYYDPVTCRFISPDDLSYLNPESINGLNLYVYCNNNPVMYVDPNGYMPELLKALFVLGAAVLTIAAVAVITVATGGSALPVIVGAAVGMAVSGTVSAVGQLISTRTINAGKLITDMSIGGVFGAFGGSALGLAGMTVSGAGTGFLGSIAEDFVSGKSINWGAAIGSGILGGFLSFIGGAGAQYGKLNRVIKFRKRMNTINKKGIIGKYAIKTKKRLVRELTTLNLTSFRTIFNNLFYTIESTVVDYIL